MPRPPPPVIDHPYVFSVSQIETFELCPRKWALNKIDGIETPENKFAVIGKKCHDLLEGYLKKGIAINPHSQLGRIVFPGLQYLPIPKTPGMKVEEWFDIKFGVAAYRGLKDVEILKPKNSRYPLVMDHKTTRNLIWMKSPEDLLQDTQAGIYSADCINKTGENYVDLHWQYYKTEGKPHSEPVQTRISRSQVDTILTRTNVTAEKMVRTLKMYPKGRGIEVTPNFSSCNAYGGCPFKEAYCKPKPTQVLKAIMAQKVQEETKQATSSFLNEMGKRREKKHGKKGTPEPVEDTRAEEDQEQDTVNSSDRESFEPPPPPPPKKFNGKWVQAEWDDADAEWKFPEEIEKAEKAAAAAADRKTESGKSSSSKKSSAVDDILGKKDKGAKKAQEEKPKPEPKVVEPVEAEAEEEEEEETPESTPEPAADEERGAVENEADTTLVQAVATLLDAFEEALFERLAKRLGKKK